MGHVHRSSLLISVSVEDSSCSVGQLTFVAAVLQTRFDVEQEYQLWERSVWVDDSSGNLQIAVVPQPNITIYGVTFQIRIANRTSFTPWTQLAAALANLDFVTFLVEKTLKDFVFKFAVCCSHRKDKKWPQDFVKQAWRKGPLTRHKRVCKYDLE